MNLDDVCPIILNGQNLPQFKEIKHLGNILQSDNSMTSNRNVKRAKFISKLHSLDQEFYCADPRTVVKLFDIYACDFYGSQLWDLNNADCAKLYNSWNVSMRILRNTHRYPEFHISKLRSHTDM